MFVIKELLTPKISAEVTAEIARAIEILKEEPAIKEAKLFGSAIKGRWRPIGVTSTLQFFPTVKIDCDPSMRN